MTLEIHSEKYSPNGNLSAEGYERLMGTPSLELLTVLVRESLQNSCDATLDDSSGARARIRVRRLEIEQREALTREVFNQLPEDRNARGLLREVLEGPVPLHVLEIADYGTSGLGGPTRADEEPADGERPDFVNFFRNVGAARDVQGGGGTYGYGKSTLYLSSHAHTILVDTVTTCRGVPVRRMMAAQLGRAVPGRFTGRHWWGVTTEDGTTVDPLTGNDAARLARLLGLPERDYSDSGTTIMVIAPHFVDPADGSVEALAAAIEENVIWYFWPRMMQTTPADMRLAVDVSHGGDWRRVTQPERFPPVSLLCRAMNALRKGQATEENIRLKPIRCLNPVRELGTMAVAEGPAKQRRWLLPPDMKLAEDEQSNGLTSIIPEKLNHVALMRPAELVVTYLAGVPSPEDTVEWGGVFRCSEAPEIEEAFARSEPPAHDAWQPESLPSRTHERRYVNVALRRIREGMPHERNDPRRQKSISETAPLGQSAELLGTFLAAGKDSRSGNRSGGTRVTRNLAGFDLPVPAGLENGQKGAIAVFKVNIHGQAEGMALLAQPGVVIDGRSEVPDEATGVPEVLSWTRKGTGETFIGNRLPVVSKGVWEVRLTVPEASAVSLHVEPDYPDEGEKE